MNRVIITVVGKDTIGIIAGICNHLAEHDINILDISQTILQGIFNMMMIVDIEKADVDFAKLSEGLMAVGNEKGVIVKCQREEIFTSMHRV